MRREKGRGKWRRRGEGIGKGRGRKIGLERQGGRGRVRGRGRGRARESEREGRVAADFQRQQVGAGPPPVKDSRAAECLRHLSSGDTPASLKFPPESRQPRPPRIQSGLRRLSAGTGRPSDAGRGDTLAPRETIEASAAVTDRRLHSCLTAGRRARPAACRCAAAALSPVS